MGQPKVVTTVNTNGLGNPLPGFDHYSMFLSYYKASAAVGGYSAIGDKIYASLAEAVTDGIVDTCVEATAATSAQIVTAAGTDGDVITLTWTKYDGTIVTLGSYTKVTADSTVTLVKTALVAAINALTYSTGWSATAGATGAWTLTAPKIEGIYPNTKSVTQTLSAGATIAVTNGALSGGTKSRLAIWHYQISRFFARNPKGILFFKQIWDDSAQSATAFETQVTSNIYTAQQAFAVLNTSASGSRQFTVYAPERTSTTTLLTAVKTARDTMQANYVCSSAWVFADLSASALSAFPNTRALTASGVSQIISQSSTGQGLYIYSCQQPQFGHAGEFLGAESAINVANSVGEVQSLNISDGTENEKTQFIDSSYTDYTALVASNQNRLDTLCDYGYVYARKIPNVTGTYIVEGNCAVAISDDLAHRETCRTIDKAIRNVYSGIVLLLNAKNKLNSDGTLSEQAKANYFEKAGVPLTQMTIDEEISQDPSTNGGIIVSSAVIVAGVIPITIKIIPQIIGREIDLNIGFVTSI